MAETHAHKRAKMHAAGHAGRTEKSLPDGRRLDAVTSRQATEVERGASMSALSQAAARLKASHKPQKVLQVPHPHMPLAAQAARRVGVNLTVKNMGGSKSRHVRGR